MNEEIKGLLVALRTLVAFAAKLTPTQYDDLIVEWLSYLIGEGPLPAQPHPAMVAAMQADGNYAAIDWSKLPWDKLLPLILPIIEQRLPEIISAIITYLEKWLNSKDSPPAGSPA